MSMLPRYRIATSAVAVSSAQQRWNVSSVRPSVGGRALECRAVTTVADPVQQLSTKQKLFKDTINHDSSTYSIKQQGPAAPQYRPCLTSFLYSTQERAAQTARRVAMAEMHMHTFGGGSLSARGTMVNAAAAGRALMCLPTVLPFSTAQPYKTAALVPSSAAAALAIAPAAAAPAAYETMKLADAFNAADQSKPAGCNSNVKPASAAAQAASKTNKINKTNKIKLAGHNNNAKPADSAAAQAGNAANNTKLLPPTLDVLRSADTSTAAGNTVVGNKAVSAATAGCMLSIGEAQQPTRSQAGSVANKTKLLADLQAAGMPTARANNRLVAAAVGAMGQSVQQRTQKYLSTVQQAASKTQQLGQPQTAAAAPAAAAAAAPAAAKKSKADRYKRTAGPNAMVAIHRGEVV